MINEEPEYWPRYTIKDHHRLRHQFSESERVRRNWSQSMQDMFVLSMLDGKRNGVYVDIGADKPKIITTHTYLKENLVGEVFLLNWMKVKLSFLISTERINASVQMQLHLIINLFFKREIIQSKLITFH